MRFPKKIPTKYVIPLVLASMIGTAAATMTLFTHTFPSVATQPPPSALFNNCHSGVLTAEGPTPIEGTSGSILFDCNALILGQPTQISAVVVVTTTPTTVTPIFLLPSDYSGLFLVSWTGQGQSSCSPTSGTQLVSGTGIIVGGTAIPSNVYAYCAAYSSAPPGSFPSFNVTWTQ